MSNLHFSVIKQLNTKATKHQSFLQSTLIAYKTFLENLHRLKAFGLFAGFGHQYCIQLTLVSGSRARHTSSGLQVSNQILLIFAVPDTSNKHWETFSRNMGYKISKRSQIGSKKAQQNSA